MSFDGTFNVILNVFDRYVAFQSNNIFFHVDCLVSVFCNFDE